MLKPPLKLIGAKTKIRPFLYQFFPEHQSYIEPFMGTAGVLVGKPGVVHEVTGDMNWYAINFYKVLQQEPEAFWNLYQQELELLCQSGKEYFIMAKGQVVCTTNSRVLRAVLFYLITKVCMNGIWRLNKKGECNSSYCGQTHGRGFMDREWFDKTRERIKDVIFVNLPYQQTLELANTDSFILCDPPYSRCKTTYNGVKWDDEDFIELAVQLEKTKARWLLTINDNEFIRELFKDYQIVPHEVHYSCSQTNAGRGKKPELLIANYDIETKGKELGLI